MFDFDSGSDSDALHLSPPRASAAAPLAETQLMTADADDMGVETPSQSPRRAMKSRRALVSAQPDALSALLVASSGRTPGSVAPASRLRGAARERGVRIMFSGPVGRGGWVGGSEEPSRHHWLCLPSNEPMDRLRGGIAAARDTLRPRNCSEPGSSMKLTRSAPENGRGGYFLRVLFELHSPPSLSLSRRRRRSRSRRRCPTRATPLLIVFSRARRLPCLPPRKRR